MITAGKCGIYSDLPKAAEETHGTFAEHQEELRWLAIFLTGNHEMAKACLVNACAFTQASSEPTPAFMPVSPVFAVIDCSFEIERTRIAELSHIYKARDCFHTAHELLPPESLEFIVAESELIRSRLDTLCRFVLVICGIEKFSWVEAARWLRISPLAVEGAYCAALESLEVIDCEAHLEQDAGIAAWN